jgi:hypothetical protein
MSEQQLLSPVVQNVKTVLALWTKLALNVRMRDRSVKVLQYGCQMLIGYWGAQLKEKSLLQLSTLRRASSNSRKAFWLLKSINHVGSIVGMIEDGTGTRASSPFVDKLDFIEQLFLVLYYWYESEIYFARAGMFGLDEDVIDPWCNWTWLGGDVAFFFSGLLRLREHIKQRRILKDKLILASEQQQHQQQQQQQQLKEANGSHVVTTAASRLEELQLELKTMDRTKFDLQLSLAIGVLELGVSLHYCDVYKFILREHISETYVGAMGVASSVLILYEGLIKARRELGEDV